MSSRTKRRHYIAPAREQDTIPDPEVPHIQMSIDYDGERWLVTTYKGEWKNSHSFDPLEHLDPLQAVYDLIELPACALCAAPLWEVNGRKVCSRHLDHHQAEPQVGRWTFGKYASNASTLPQIVTVKGPKLLDLPWTKKAWAAFEKNYESPEITETTGLGGERIINARLQAETGKPTKRKKPAASRPTGDTILREKYDAVCAVLAEHKIVPPSFEAWQENYLRVQARIQQKATALDRQENGAV